MDGLYLKLFTYLFIDYLHVMLLVFFCNCEKEMCFALDITQHIQSLIKQCDDYMHPLVWVVKYRDMNFTVSF